MPRSQPKAVHSTGLLIFWSTKCSSFKSCLDTVNYNHPHPFSHHLPFLCPEYGASEECAETDEPPLHHDGLRWGAANHGKLTRDLYSL